MYFSFRKEQKEEIIKDLQVMRKYMTQTDFDVLISRIQKARRAKTFFKFDQKNGQRSLDQNAYYWGCVIPFVHYLKAFPRLAVYELTDDLMMPNGTEQEVSQIYHGLLSQQFLSYWATFTDGSFKKGVAGSSSLSIEAFENYLMLISEWVFEHFGYYLPSPDEYEMWSIQEAKYDDSVDDYFLYYTNTYTKA